MGKGNQESGYREVNKSMALRTRTKRDKSWRLRWSLKARSYQAGGLFATVANPPGWGNQSVGGKHRGCQPAYHDGSALGSPIVRPAEWDSVLCSYVLGTIAQFQYPTEWE